MNGNIFETILMEVNICIEIETCFGILNFDLTDSETANLKYFETVQDKIINFKNLLQTNEQKLYDIDYIKSSNATEYYKWHLMYDESILCYPEHGIESFKFSKFYHSGQEYSLTKHPNIHFHPIEIVTTKMHIILD